MKRTVHQPAFPTSSRVHLPGALRPGLHLLPALLLPPNAPFCTRFLPGCCLLSCWRGFLRTLTPRILLGVSMNLILLPLRSPRSSLFFRLSTCAVVSHMVTVMRIAFQACSALAHSLIPLPKLSHIFLA